MKETRKSQSQSLEAKMSQRTEMPPNVAVLPTLLLFVEREVCNMYTYKQYLPLFPPGS